MGYIDNDDVRRVREATDLVALVSEHVILRKKGRLFWGCCPFHNEKTPSFKVDPATQLWHCFGCGKGGDVFGYIKESEKLDFPEAVRLLADRAHIEIKETGQKGLSRSERQRLYEANNAAKRFFHTELMRSRSAQAKAARLYLSERGFDSEISKKWELGFAPGSVKCSRYVQSQGFRRDDLIKANLAFARDNGSLTDRFFNRIMFPVHDLQGNTIAFGGRVIGTGEPKYLNTSETPVFHKSNSMFGIHRAKNAFIKHNIAIVVEGYTDVIAMHEYGFENTVATLGTALTEQHVRLLSRFAQTIVYLFDGDAAGQKAAMRASEFIDWSSALESQRNPIELKVALLPDELDPADFLAKYGTDRMQSYLDSAESLLRFCIDATLKKFDLNSPEMKARALREAVQLLLPLKGSVSAADYINLLADRLHLDYTTVQLALQESKVPMAARHHYRSTTPELNNRAVRSVSDKIIEADRKAISIEYEIIALLISNSVLISEVKEELGRIEWTDSDVAQIVKALCSLDYVPSSIQAYSIACEASSQAAQIISSVSFDVSDVYAIKKRVKLLLAKMRERDIKQRIRNAKTLMRELDSTDTNKADALFRQTIALQKELKTLRKNELKLLND